MLNKVTTKRNILLQAGMRVMIATLCTVAAMIGVAYFAKALMMSQSSIILSSVLAGVCGFVIGIYYTMRYLVRSGYKTK